MEKNIVIYNDNTGVSVKMGPLFAGEGIQVKTARSLEELLMILRDDNIRLLLIDVEPDGRDWREGVTVLSRIRRESMAPMIVVSAQSCEEAKITALEAGADDYVVADCNPLELLARVKCQIHRYNELAGESEDPERIYKVGGLEVNDRCHRVTVDGREVRLTPIEYKILKLLVKERGRVLSIRQIYEAAWHMQAIGADNTIAVHVRHIREKIERDPKDPCYLKVVWGTGYKVG